MSRVRLGLPCTRPLITFTKPWRDSNDFLDPSSVQKLKNIAKFQAKKNFAKFLVQKPTWTPGHCMVRSTRFNPFPGCTPFHVVISLEFTIISRRLSKMLMGFYCGALMCTLSDLLDCFSSLQRAAAGLTDTKTVASIASGNLFWMFATS